ncbi:hypothetical protein LUX33_24145 [Actinomadura madurae]|uniref:hypothetical protein n=1 Tax=Actinomadura madurae TaxID=1993 RepID=UPI0020D1F8BE|nr:hypothetical protein [Actinomadura madurae]MCP9951207.1 hypothetical protein [Actinomadura madurae]
MKLITFDEGRVGRLDGDDVIELDVPSTRAFFERGGTARRDRGAAQAGGRPAPPAHPPEEVLPHRRQLRRPP